MGGDKQYVRWEHVDLSFRRYPKLLFSLNQVVSILLLVMALRRCVLNSINQKIGMKLVALNKNLPLISQYGQVILSFVHDASRGV